MSKKQVKKPVAKKSSNTLSKESQKKVDQLVKKYVDKMELKHKEIIKKLKDQHTIDINGYGDKIVEHKKMIAHLNKELNSLSSKKSPVKYIAKYQNEEYCKKYIKEFCNDPSIKYDFMKIDERHYVVTAVDL